MPGLYSERAGVRKCTFGGSKVELVGRHGFHHCHDLMFHRAELFVEDLPGARGDIRARYRERAKGENGQNPNFMYSSSLPLVQNCIDIALVFIPPAQSGVDGCNPAGSIDDDRER